MRDLLSRLVKRKIGIGALVLQLVASVILAVLVIRLHVLNYSYTALVAILLAVVFVLLVLANGVKNKFHYVAKAMSVVLAIVCVFGSYYCTKAKETVESMTDKNVQIDCVSIYVLKTNSASTINDVADGLFATLKLEDNGKVDDAVKTIVTNVGKVIKTEDYKDPVSAAKALYEKNVDAIIMDDSFVGTIEEQDTYKNFGEETKILVSYEHKTMLKNENKISDVTEKPFNVFISGIDTFGDVNKKSRSDVNMVATINPKTKQILLSSTPRDYYVNTTVSGDMKDKLTHAGLYGTKCSIGTLESLYNIKINYYVKVNFSGFKKIVDALGGVTVHSDCTFTSDQGPAFVEGDNEMNGKEALAFARQRHGFKTGDLQRNKNQQYVLKGIIDKLCSPAILTNFSEILKSIEGNMITNLEYDDIASFVQMQLTDNASWNIITVGVDGDDESLTTYSMPSTRAYVMIPDDIKVANVTSLINRISAGEKISQKDAKEIVATTPTPAPTPTEQPKKK